MTVRRDKVIFVADEYLIIMTASYGIKWMFFVLTISLIN